MNRPSEIAERWLRGSPIRRGERAAVALALLDLRRGLHDMRGAVESGNDRLATWIDAILDERKERSDE